ISKTRPSSISTNGRGTGNSVIIAETSRCSTSQWKIFARIPFNRLNGHLKQGLLPESQCGFRRHRGTTDMITCQLQEKFQEMRTHLYTTFVDLNGHLKQGLLPESQCGFRRHRGTTDMIFAARSRKANVASADTAEQPI
ncbi:unnamed protein product, partial [Schistocephalus solidus]|uniref:Reverse transcriptase domain-containing protein n=1 Tax=Schistocephalus solidus TaxID=70667 RepID=A0A183SCK9_SCHSO